MRLHLASWPGMANALLTAPDAVTRGKAMRVPGLLLALPLLAACSTTRPAVVPSAVVPEPSGGEIAGQWTGNWTGTGIFYSSRGDAVSINFVQEGNLGHGRLVLESTGAAEAVPWEVRRAGMWGTAVI